MILVLQAELIQQGFNPGPIDGMWGSKTRKAVNNFQRAKGIRYAAEIKGMPNGETLRKLFGAKFKSDKYGLTQDDQLSQDIYEKYCK
jgi:peptidoglycan hydrolase-like protein with peptidoglycan-binding domain